MRSINNNNHFHEIECIIELLIKQNILIGLKKYILKNIPFLNNLISWIVLK